MSQREFESWMVLSRSLIKNEDDNNTKGSVESLKVVEFKQEELTNKSKGQSF